MLSGTMVNLTGRASNRACALLASISTFKGLYHEILVFLRQTIPLVHGLKPFEFVLDFAEIFLNMSVKSKPNSKIFSDYKD
jgi:hypothetical protein